MYLRKHVLPDFFCFIYIASDQKFTFLQFEDCKSKIKVSASLVSSEASCLGWPMAGCFLTVSSHGLSLCSTCLLSLPLIRTSVIMG